MKGPGGRLPGPFIVCRTRPGTGWRFVVPERLWRARPGNSERKEPVPGGVDVTPRRVPPASRHLAAGRTSYRRPFASCTHGGGRIEPDPDVHPDAPTQALSRTAWPALSRRPVGNGAGPGRRPADRRRRQPRSSGSPSRLGRLPAGAGSRRHRTRNGATSATDEAISVPSSAGAGSSLGRSRRTPAFPRPWHPPMAPPRHVRRLPGGPPPDPARTAGTVGTGSAPYRRPSSRQAPARPCSGAMPAPASPASTWVARARSDHRRERGKAPSACLLRKVPLHVRHPADQLCWAFCPT